MAFNITVLDKAGNIVDWNTLDAEVCELWACLRIRNPGVGLREKVIQMIGMNS